MLGASQDYGCGAWSPEIGQNSLLKEYCSHCFMSKVIFFSDYCLWPPTRVTNHPSLRPSRLPVSLTRVPKCSRSVPDVALALPSRLRSAFSCRMESLVNLAVQGPFYQTPTDLQILNTTSALSTGLFFRNLGLCRRYLHPALPIAAFSVLSCSPGSSASPGPVQGCALPPLSLSAAPGARPWNYTLCLSMALAPGIWLCSSPHTVSHRAQISATNSLIHSCVVLRFHLKSTPEADFLLATYLDKFLACLHVLMLFLISFTFFFFFMIESLSSVVSSLSLSRR